MTERVYRIAQITDLHLPNRPGELTHGVDTVASLKRVVADIARQDFDLVLVSGDIAESGDEGAYEILQSVLKDFSSVVVIPGNHDQSPHYEKHYGNSRVQVHSLGPWTLLAADSASETIEPELLEECHKIMASHDSVLLAIHHPLIPLGPPLFDEVWALTNRDHAYQQLAESSSLKGVVFGHTHAEHRVKVEGVLHFGAPATSYYLEAHPTEETFEQIEKHGYQVIELSDKVTARVCYV